MLPNNRPYLHLTNPVRIVSPSLSIYSFLSLLQGTIRTKLSILVNVGRYILHLGHCRPLQHEGDPLDDYRVQSVKGCILSEVM